MAIKPKFSRIVWLFLMGCLVFVNGCETPRSSDFREAPSIAITGTEGIKINRFLPDQFWLNPVSGERLPVPEKLRLPTPEWKSLCNDMREKIERDKFTTEAADLFFRYADFKGPNPMTGGAEWSLWYNEVGEDGLVTIELVLPERGQRGSSLDACVFVDKTVWFFGDIAGVSIDPFWDGTQDEQHQYVSVRTVSCDAGYDFWPCDGHSYTIVGDFRGSLYLNLISNPTPCEEGEDRRFTDITSGGSHQYCVKAKLKVKNSLVKAWTTKQESGITQDTAVWANGTSMLPNLGTSSSVNCSLFIAPHLAMQFSDGENTRWMWQARNRDIGENCDSEGYGWEWPPEYCDPEGNVSCVGSVVHGRMEWANYEWSTPGVRSDETGFSARWNDMNGDCENYPVGNSSDFYFAYLNGQAWVTIRTYLKGSCAIPC